MSVTSSRPVAAWWLRFVIGVTGSLLPVALIAVAPAAFYRDRIDRSDVAWMCALVAYLILSVAHQAWDPNVGGLAIAWLVFRAARRIAGPSAGRQALGVGFVLGTLALASFAILEVAVFGRPRAQGPIGFDHPNVLAHALLVVGVGAVATMAAGATRAIGLAGAVVGLLLSGSRSGLLGLMVTAFALVVERRSRLALALMAIVVATIATVAVLAVGSPWAQRILGPLEAPFAGARPSNLVVASEALANPAAWAPSGVEVRTLPARGDARIAVHHIERVRSVDWARPQQLITLDAEMTYTMSAEFRRHGDGEPGLLGWAQDPSGDVEIRVSLASDVARVHHAVGFRDVTVDAASLSEGWTRLEVTLTVDRSRPIDLAFGPSPDLASTVAGATTEVRALQIEAGPQATPYVPTRRIRVGAGEALARLPIWRAALSGLFARPWFGWGTASFPAYFAGRGDVGVASPLPSHAHNQLLSSAFDGGLIGLLGLGCLVAALLGGRRGWSRAALLGLLVGNLFDSTLLIGAVLLPAAFLSGAAAATCGDAPPSQRPGSRGS